MCFLVHCGIGCVCVSSLVCREKPQRGSLKKLQAHRKQRSTHCENILYQGEVGKIPPHTYITVECLVSVDKGAETEGGRESHVVLQDPREQREENVGWRSVGRFWRPTRR